MTEPEKTKQRRGITVAGNIIADVVKNVDCYPKPGMLANIQSVSKSVGGCAPNTAIDLAKIDGTLPVSVIGRIGDDEYGKYVLSQLCRYGIDCEKILETPGKPTSFSDVISLETGERTFFHARGANAVFSPEDIDVDSLRCAFFHIGYILLLDGFDKKSGKNETAMSKFLREVRSRGIKTSVDMVSDSTADYKAIVLPALPYCDYIIINEIESGRIADVEPYNPNGRLVVDNVKRSMRYLAENGVKEKVIVHCKKAGFCYDIVSGSFTAVPSLNIPQSLIKGSVGAGDAFCAACLYGLYGGYDDDRMLRFAASAAACALFSENSVDGMLNKDKIEKLPERFGWREL